MNCMASLISKIVKYNASYFYGLYTSILAIFVGVPDVGFDKVDKSQNVIP